MISNLRAEANALEAELAEERSKSVQLVSEMASKEAMIFEQRQAIKKMADMAKHVRVLTRARPQVHPSALLSGLVK